MRIDALNDVIVPRLAVIGSDATLRAAAFRLSSPHIGLVVVCGEGGTVEGVVSKSDLIRHLTVARPRKRPSRTR